MKSKNTTTTTPTSQTLKWVTKSSCVIVNGVIVEQMWTSSLTTIVKGQPFTARTVLLIPASKGAGYEMSDNAENYVPHTEHGGKEITTDLENLLA